MCSVDVCISARNQILTEYIVDTPIWQQHNAMGLFQKWMSLPLKARYYIAGSTFIFALIGDYVSTRVNDEVQGRRKVLEELNGSDSKSKWIALSCK